MRLRARRESSAQCARYFAWSGTSSRLLYCRARPAASAMFMRAILGAGDRLQPHHRLAERGAERLAFRVGERRLARLADRLRLLGGARGGRVVDQRVGDGEEVAPAAAV